MSLFQGQAALGWAEKAHGTDDRGDHLWGYFSVNIFEVIDTFFHSTWRGWQEISDSEVYFPEI